MLLVVNQTNVIENDVKIKDLIQLIHRYHPVTYTQHIFPDDIDKTYNTLKELFIEDASKDKLISLKADLLDRLYKSYIHNEKTSDTLKYQMSLLYLDHISKHMIKSISIGKHKFNIVTVDLFPIDSYIKGTLEDEIPCSYLENLFELLDKGLISIINFKENHPDYPDSLGLIKDKLYYALRVKYEFLKNSPSGYRYTSLYHLLRGTIKNITITKKEDGSTTKSELDNFSTHLDKIAKELSFSKSKIGFAIF